MKRDVGLKPRKVGDLPPEKLAEIMERIWPQEIALDLMNNLGFGDEKNGNNHSAMDTRDGAVAGEEW